MHIKSEVIDDHISLEVSLECSFLGWNAWFVPATYRYIGAPRDQVHDQTPGLSAAAASAVFGEIKTVQSQSWPDVYVCCR